MYMAKILMSLTVILWSGAAVAGSISMQLDRTVGFIGEPFYLTIILSGEVESDLSLSQVEGLIFEGGGVSRNASNINGVVHREIRVSYQIRAQQAGTFTIPPVKAVIDGKEEVSLPLSFEVKAGAGGSKPKAPDQVASDHGVVIDRHCDTTQPFVGQQVQCKTKFLYPRTVSPRTGATGASAEFRRFATGRPRQYQTYHAGRRYDVVEWNEVVVPTSSGKKELPAFVVEGAVRELNRRGTPLDEFFGGGSIMFSMPGYKEATLVGEALAFEVQPLPEQGQPPSFKGLVGNYNMTVNVSAGQVKQGETVTITVVLSGRGISDHVPQPVLDMENIGRIYADKPRYEEGISPEEGVTSVREFKLAFVPSKVGDFDLPVIEIPYFNPEKKSYEVLRQDLGRLQVLPSEASQNPELLSGQGTPASDKRDVKTLGQDLIGLHRHADVMASHAATAMFRTVCAAAGGIPLLSALLFAGWLRLGGSHVRHRKQRQARAGARFQEGLRKSSAMVSQNPSAAVVQGYLAVRTYIASRFDVEAGALTPRDVKRVLTQTAASPNALERLEALCEQAAHIDYGGTSFTAEAASAWLNDVGQCMQEVEAK